MNSKDNIKNVYKKFDEFKKKNNCEKLWHEHDNIEMRRTKITFNSINVNSTIYIFNN